MAVALPIMRYVLSLKSVLSAEIAAFASWGETGGSSIVYQEHAPTILDRIFESYLRRLDIFKGVLQSRSYIKPRGDLH